jgi:trans-2,3-dihydro-3-hydroxyanthranilate isomerase
MPHPFFVVDVFAERKYAGNQLAVIFDAADLTSAEMQAIARETNFSETTFVLAREPRDGGWPVRIFTPAAELPFAGHPTLGTADVIRRELLGGRGDELTLALAVGLIPVTVERTEPGPEVLWMRQRPPLVGHRAAHAEAAAALGLGPEDLDRDFPVEALSTGVFSLMVPLRSLDALGRARIVDEPYSRLTAAAGTSTVLLFCRGARQAENQLAVRVFARDVGVPEDSATGSANGCLAAYLARHRVLGGGELAVRVEQGYEMGRPSLLRLRARETPAGIEVQVGGRVVPVVRGEID